MKIAVYTCVTAGYDTVKPPREIGPGIDLLCFTEAPDTVAAPWRGVRLNVGDMDAKDLNRFVKMKPHRVPELADYDLTIYVDGSIELIGRLDQLAERCLNAGPHIHLYDHPFRDCAYEEALACVRFGLTPLGVTLAQMRRYRAAGYPRHAGLSECGVIVRRRHPDLDRVMDAWWDEYRHGARRDQLSFGYAAWSGGLDVGSLGPSDPRFAQRMFRLHAHAPRGGLQRWRTSLRARWNRTILRLVPSARLFGHGPT